MGCTLAVVKFRKKRKEIRDSRRENAPHIELEPTDHVRAGPHQQLPGRFGPKPELSGTPAIPRDRLARAPGDKPELDATTPAAVPPAPHVPMSTNTMPAPVEIITRYVPAFELESGVHHSAPAEHDTVTAFSRPTSPWHHSTTPQGSPPPPPPPASSAWRRPSLASVPEAVTRGVDNRTPPLPPLDYIVSPLSPSPSGAAGQGREYHQSLGSDGSHREATGANGANGAEPVTPYLRYADRYP